MTGEGNQPVVVSRPPRAPNHRPPTVDTAAASSSSSSDIPNGPSSCRSTHFLDGFNVEGCFDVRSIPSPPTPQPRNRRRLSSPMVSLRSLEDVTNQSVSSEKAKGTKRARKSLCHVPAPLNQTKQEIKPFVPVNKGENPTASRPKLTIYIDDDDDDNDDEEKDQSVSVGKRRKKRQSIVLPSELVQPQGSSPEKSSVQDSSPLLKKTFTGSLQEMKGLRSLVHRYSLLPSEERASSIEAKTIEQRTGYPLTASGMETEMNTLDPLGKRKLIAKISPVIEEMDKRKVEDTKMWERVTQCRVEKSKSGKYRYYHITTGTKVPVSEYQSRYMAVIHHNKAQTLRRANEWKAKLVEATTEENAQEVVKNISMDEDKEENEMDQSSFEETVESAIVALDKQVEQDTLPLPTEKDNVELTNQSNDLESVNDMSHSVGIPKDDGQSNETSNEEESPVNEELIQEESSSFETQILPLPPRDQSSTDPDLAKAERRLWSRIDSALEDYSNEVVAIMRRKRTQSNQNVD